jgi:DNA-binding MarR family transcriptional regulator
MLKGNLKMSGLFKMPNALFNQKLSATAYRVAAALYSCQSRYVVDGKRCISVTQKRLAETCGLTDRPAVSKAVTELHKKGLIAAVRRTRGAAGLPGNYEYILDERIFKGGYFFVQRNIFKQNLSTAQMRMYLYFCKCVLSNSRKCWNSFNDISQALGIKRENAIKDIQSLIKLRLIRRSRIKNDNNTYSDNHYNIIYIPDFKIAIRKKPKRQKRKNAFPSVLSKTISHTKKIDLLSEIILQYLNLLVKGFEKSFLSFLKNFKKLRSKYNLFLPRGSPNRQTTL